MPKSLYRLLIFLMRQICLLKLFAKIKFSQKFLYLQYIPYNGKVTNELLLANSATFFLQNLMAIVRFIKTTASYFYKQGYCLFIVWRSIIKTFLY